MEIFAACSPDVPFVAGCHGCVWFLHRWVRPRARAVAVVVV